MNSKVLFLVTFLFFVTDCHAQILTCDVISVIDGDTVKVMFFDGTQQNVRLCGIDAPEIKQDYGKASQRMLSVMIGKKTVTLQIKGKDKYGRLIVCMYLNKVSISAAMVKSGNAWVYKKYCKEDICKKWLLYQKYAENNSKGLWKNANPVPPSQWRAIHNNRNYLNNNVKTIYLNKVWPSYSSRSHRYFSPVYSRNSSYTYKPSYGGKSSGISRSPDNSLYSVKVRGYYRKDGTYVKPHRRRRPK